MESYGTTMARPSGLAKVARRAPGADVDGLERVVGRASAFERGGRQRHHGLAARFAEGVHRRPSGDGSVGAGVDAGQPVLADGLDVHAIDQRPVLVRAHGHHQAVVGNALATGGDHGIGGGVEFGHPVFHPFHARRHEVGVAVNHLADRPHARGHQGLDGLAVVLFLGVDDGDPGAVQHLGQPVRQCQAAQAAAGNDDVRCGGNARSLRRVTVFCTCAVRCEKEKRVVSGIGPGSAFQSCA